MENGCGRGRPQYSRSGDRRYYLAIPESRGLSTRKDDENCGIFAPLWRTRLFEVFIFRQHGRTFHIRTLLYTALLHSLVGDVENIGTVTAVITLISKYPEMHSPVLENLAIT
jgi:hypothetical protein